jgi:hypothetical protein
MTTFNRDRFTKRQQQRKYQQAQREQNMLLLIDELKIFGITAVIESGEMVLYLEPELREILICHAHEFFTREQNEFSPTLKHMLLLASELDDHAAFLEMLHTVWMCRDYLRDWKRTTAKYDRDEIKISVSEKLSNVFSFGETNDAQ